jgi:hypothetical protein
MEMGHTWGDCRGDIERGFRKEGLHCRGTGLVGYPGHPYTRPATPARPCGGHGHETGGLWTKEGASPHPGP